MRKETKYFILGIIFTLVITMGVPTVASSIKKTIEVSTGVVVELNGERFNPTDVNGNPVEIFIYNGTTYLPVRAVSNALGVKVGWDGDTNTVLLGETPVKEVPEDLSWVGNYREYITHAYGSAMNSSETFSKDSIPYLEIREDGTYTHRTNWYYTMYEFEGTWKVEGDYLILSKQEGLNTQVKFKKRSGNELELVLDKDLGSSHNEYSTSTNGDLYRK